MMVFPKVDLEAEKLPSLLFDKIPLKEKMKTEVNDNVTKWRRGVVVTTSAQVHSNKPELRFCAGSSPAHGEWEIRDGEHL